MRTKDQRPPSSQRGYDARWRKVRAMKLRANPLCEECEKGKVLTPASMVHHIVPIEEGGEVLDLENLMALCESCHDKKHSKNSIGNVGGCDPSGFPISQAHPWRQMK